MRKEKEILKEFISPFEELEDELYEIEKGNLGTEESKEKSDKKN